MQLSMTGYKKYYNGSQLCWGYFLFCVSFYLLMLALFKTYVFLKVNC